VAISGYPRTGTTYLQHLINLAYLDNEACWKNHDALSLSWYAESCAVAGITLREPRNTVISNAIYHGDRPSNDLMRFRLKSYSAWHREIIRAVCKQPIAIFRFADFTIDPKGTLAKFCPDAHDFSPTESDVRNAFANEGRQTELPDSRRNLPSGSRDVRKQEFENLFETRRVNRAYVEAYNLYLELDSMQEPVFEHLDRPSGVLRSRSLAAMSAGTAGVAASMLGLSRVVG
jgi:hypothetical protein